MAVGRREKVQTPAFGTITGDRLKRLAKVHFCAGESREWIIENLGVRKTTLAAWIGAGKWEEARREREEILYQQMMERVTTNQAAEDAKALDELVKRRAELVEKMLNYGDNRGDDVSRGLRAVQAVIDRLAENVAATSGRQIVGFEFISVDNGPTPEEKAAVGKN